MNKRLGEADLYQVFISFYGPNHYDKDANEMRFTKIFLVKLFPSANSFDVFKASKMR